MGEAGRGGEGRGTRKSTGGGLRMAMELGAEGYGCYGGGQATGMDLHMAEYGGLALPAGERKNYRRSS